MLAPVRITAPAAAPVSLAEAKAHCRVDGTDSDTVLSMLIDAAVAHLDGWTGILGRAMVTQTWRQDFPGFGRRLRLPVGPVASVTSISYQDAIDATQTLSADVYAVRTDALGGYLEVKPGQSWPTTFARPDAVIVTYVAGTAAAEVPAALKVAVLMLVAAWFENREAVGEAMAEIPLSVHALVAPYRRVGV